MTAGPRWARGAGPTKTCCPTSGASSATRRAIPGHRGKSGPILVEDYRTILPITHRFVEAAQQAGHRFAKDLSARPPAEGVG